MVILNISDVGKRMKIQFDMQENLIWNITFIKKWMSVFIEAYNTKESSRM